MIEIKTYVDSSTKLIIEEIRLSRGQPTPDAQQHDDATHNVAQSTKDPTNMSSVSMDEHVHISNTNDHDVGQCIREFKLLVNIAWDRIDEVIIPINVSEKFHWLLVVFRIKRRCQHVYDLMSGGSVYNKKVKGVVDKPATTIPLFLASTKFYGKKLDLYANNLPEYIHKT
ncbi:hypothetical protein EJD97_020082, partial [Solanum chilense]